MSRRVVGLTLDNLDHLPRTCRRCVFWELAPHVREQADEFGEAALEKEAWVSNVLLDWGSCGRVLYLDDVPVGYALYAPPATVPHASTFPTGPVSADAVLLTALRIDPEFEHGGLGRVLVQNVARDLTRRGVNAVEAFGDLQESGGGCIIPAGFLQQVGFKTVRRHPKWPRLRLELRTALSWKEDVEAALERLLSTVSVRTAEPALG